jgi:phage terminase small subunit
VSGRLPGSPARSRLLGRRNGRQAAPAGPTAPAEPPKDLEASAQRVYRRDAPLVPGGLKAADRTTFTTMCRIQALTERWLSEAEAAPTAEKIPQSLWAAVKLAKLVAELRRPFGLSLTDRQRLHVEPEKDEDEYEKFQREHPRS